jgi:translation initiation factor 1
MGRGKKLDLFIGAQIENDWAQVQEKKQTVSNKIIEPSKHSLFFKKEKRRGKVVTLVGEFQISKEDASKILKSIKKKLGCGGSYKNNFMEFQGEIKDRLKEILIQDGFRFKK